MVIAFVVKTSTPFFLYICYYTGGTATLYRIGSIRAWRYTADIPCVIQKASPISKSRVHPAAFPKRIKSKRSLFLWVRCTYRKKHTIPNR